MATKVSVETSHSKFSARAVQSSVIHWVSGDERVCGFRHLARPVRPVASAEQPADDHRTGPAVSAVTLLNPGPTDTILPFDLVGRTRRIGQFAVVSPLVRLGVALTL